MALPYQIFVMTHSPTLVGLLGPGDIESGVVAGLTSALTSVVAGGVACVIGGGAIVLAFPQLSAFDAELSIAEQLC